MILDLVNQKHSLAGLNDFSSFA